MEAVRYVSCAGLAALAGYVGIGSLDRDAPGLRVLTGRFQRALMHVAHRVGQTGWAYVLLELGPVSRCCETLSVRARSEEMAVTREDCCGLGIMVFALSLCVCALWARSPLGMIAPAAFWLVGLPLWDSSTARKRLRSLSDEMPGVFRTMAMAMGSGETLAQAIEYVGDHEGGVAGAAFQRAALKLRCGMPVHEVLGALVEELDAPGIDLLATALLISQRTGCPLRGLFLRSATLVERQGEFERMLSVKTAQVRLSVHIVSLLPAIMVCVLSLISPDFQKGLLTAPGMVSIAFASFMDIAALLIIRHLMKGVL